MKKSYEIIPFEQSSYLTQVRRLREMALNVVKKYPVKIKTIDFIRHSANAIFKITDTSQKKYLLRIHPTGYHTKDAILEEFKWLDVISKKTDIPVPKPIYNNEGKYLIRCNHPQISGVRYCNMFEWLDGRFLWKGINKKYAYNLGLLMARLQANGKQVKIKHRFYWDTDSLVGTNKVRCKNVEHLTGISKAQQRIITAARRYTYEKLKEYETSYPEKIGLMHSDLNPNNVIICGHNYGAIDFDDCGVGLYGLDFAEPLSAFEHLAANEGKNFDDLKENLFQGYSEYMPLSQRDIEMSPYFLLALKLHSIGWLELKKDNPKLRPWFLKSVERTINFFKSNKMC